MTNANHSSAPPLTHARIISGLRSMNSEPRGVANWRSPVLFVHGDDDRNVPFQQTTDLVEKLLANGALSAQHCRNITA
jgi:fermentation-respiration switch protein FrsA (DUF1100 family)